MQIVVVGNGAVGMMIAWEVLSRLPEARVTLVAPQARTGCASAAAAAMFNSFAELDTGTLLNKLEKEKWQFNRLAAPRWPALLGRLKEESKCAIHAGFGTFVINNHVSDELEDRNFDAILEALKLLDEPHEQVSPAAIPFYRPACRSRSTRAVFIPREGWVNPVDLLEALTIVLGNSGRMTWVDACCKRLESDSRAVRAVVTDDERFLSGDAYVLAPGANFSQIVQSSRLDIGFPKVFYGVGCTILLNTGDNTLNHCVRTPNRGLACGVYAAPRDPSHTVVGASNLISPVPTNHARATSVYTLLKSAIEQINRDYYRAELESINVGWRPTSEDTLPLIGRTAIENLFVATGTKRDGLHCSPLIAQCITDLIVGGEPPFCLDSFRPDRSPTRIYSRREAIETTVRQTINAAYQHDFVPAKNRMLEEMERFHRDDLEALHDQVGAIEWGIPPEMVSMYRYKHLPAASPRGGA